MLCALELHVFLSGRTPLLSVLSSVVLPFTEVMFFKMSFSSVEVESLEFALATIINWS